MTTNSQVTQVKARQVLDSRGNPTIEADVTIHNGLMGRAIVASGASTGTHEALELRDKDLKFFNGRGVLKAVTNVNNKIAPKIIGLDCTKQKEIDQLLIDLDGTANKCMLGGNAILAVSMAIAKVAAAFEKKSLYAYLSQKQRYKLPIPMMNIINGGQHAGNNLAIQEFLIEPVGAKSYSQALQFGTEVYHTLKTILKEKYGASAINVGDEGGYAPAMDNTYEALNAISEAISKSGYTTAQIKIGIDAAASSFYNKQKDNYQIDNKQYTAQELEDYYTNLVNTFPILTIEDPFYEEAYSDFTSITKKLGNQTLIIGDDLYVTNPKRIKKGITQQSTNAVLIKPNQIGTLTETLQATNIAQKAKLAQIVSHRSGETDDTFIAHLATATQSIFIKTGAPARGERIAKYNELLRIEEELGTNAQLNSYRQAIKAIPTAT
jgi:enolase